jgi:hypothetical protein
MCCAVVCGMKRVSCRTKNLPESHSPTLANNDVIVPKTISPLTLKVFPRCMAAVARLLRLTACKLSLHTCCQVRHT